MPSWLSLLLATKPHIPWIEAPLAGMTDDHHLSDSFPMPNTPTKVDDLLPPPALQNNAHTRRMHHKSTRFDGLAIHWAKFKRRIGTGTAPSSSSQIGESGVENSYIQRMGMTPDNDAIDQVVVDRVWSEETKSIESHSDHGVAPEKSGESHQYNPGTSDRESLVYEGFWSMWPPLSIIRWRTWPFIMEIFSSRFIDEKSEQHYTQVSQLELIFISMSIYLFFP